MGLLDEPLKIAFYGDDFTGATDTLATAARAGLRALLFLGIPTSAQLKNVGPLDCLGIAGAARSMSPAEMQAELEPVGGFFAGLGAPVMHYKTCSTFDSAPAIGSIGAAIRALQPHAGNAFVPIIGGQPNLRRYCVFGNLFAAAGDGLWRIDRHPTMSRHPVTPMQEADLRLHFEKQGLAPVAAIHYTDYRQSEKALNGCLNALMAKSPQAVLLDVAEEDHLATVGRLIWQQAQQQRLLAVGASSVVQALAAHWQITAEDSGLPIAAAEGPVLVLAGSLSPMTALQVAAAASYRRVALDAARLSRDEGYRAHMADEISGLLKQGRHVLAFTARGPGEETVDARDVAAACGRLLASVLETVPPARLGIAGGDTSSHAMKALGAWGLSFHGQLAPGVALCRLHSDAKELDGMEVMLKGGQMGSETLFEELLNGTV